MDKNCNKIYFIKIIKTYWHKICKLANIENQVSRNISKTNQLIAKNEMSTLPFCGQPFISKHFKNSEMSTLHVKCNISTGNCANTCSYFEIEIRIKNQNSKTYYRHIDLSRSPVTSQLIPMTNLTFIFHSLIFKYSSRPYIFFTMLGWPYNPDLMEVTSNSNETYLLYNYFGLGNYTYDNTDMFFFVFYLLWIFLWLPAWFICLYDCLITHT